MINLCRLDPRLLTTEPYEWAFVDGIFEPQDAAALVSSFPADNYKTVRGYDGEKGYAYEVRSLIGIGADVPSHVENLSPVWRRLADMLLSPAYRAAMARLLRREVDSLLMEATVFQYGPGASIGPHLDLKARIFTQIFYFNETWNSEDGGCLTILRSSGDSREVTRVSPIVGSSVVLVRSGKSWHSVTPVDKSCTLSRRSMTVTFYNPGSISSLWPPGDKAQLHPYDATSHLEATKGMPGPLTRLRRRATYLIRSTAREKLRLTK